MSREDADASDRSEAPHDAAPARAKAAWAPPAWLDHFNSHDLKTLFRCWVAAWVSLLLVFIHPALQALGQAAFFGTLLLLIIPPANIFFVYALQAFSLILGMCLAWCWGLLTMKAALSARPAAETQAKLQALQQEAAMRASETGQTAAWEAQILVHDGRLLDARVTAIFFVMGLLFIYLLARLRCSNPKLFFAQLFGTIIMDLFILFGPGLPSFTADLAAILMKPGAIGVAMGTTCCLVLFPQSTSYVVLDQMEKLVKLLNSALNTTRRCLAQESVTLAELKGTRFKMLSLYKASEPVLAFLPLDLSRGRWSADDVKGLHRQVREAMVAGLSLLDFYISHLNSKEKQQRLEEHGARREMGEKLTHEAGHQQLMESIDLMYALQDPEKLVMDEKAFHALREPTTDVLRVSSQAVDVAARCIHAVNTRRWIGKPAQAEFDDLARELDDMIATLRFVTEKCVTDTTEGVIAAYADLFGEDGQIKDPDALGPPGMKGLAVAMILEERILTAARNIESMLEYILELKHSRREHKVWWPQKVKSAFTWLFTGRHSAPTFSTTPHIDGAETSRDPDAVTDDSVMEDQSKEAYRRLRISRGYQGTSAAKRNPVSKAYISTYHWLFGTSGLFALRMVAVTLATSIPAVIPHSAGFFYREKGIWMVITAQTCILVYMADFTFSIVSRVLGSIIGGAIGMVAWYAGSGSGPGNPYGMAATTGVALPILIWLRIFLPPMFTKATILMGVTFCLVVGFSYDSEHIVQYGLPGKGYEAFWKRVVGVLLGCVAAGVVQMFPKTPSATKHVCCTLSNTVRTLSDHYALLLSHWGKAEATQRPLRAVAEEISLSVADTLLGLDQMIGLLRFEMSMSPFDQQLLKDVQEQCLYMNQSLRRLLNVSTTLPQKLQERLIQTVGFTDDAVVGDIMAVMGIIEQTLRTGSSLPERLPTPLVKRFYDSWHARNRRAMLSVDLVRDEDYRRYCVAMSSYLKFLTTIDDLVLKLKQSLGECHVVHPWEGA